MMTIAIRYIKEQTAAEDIVNESFVKIFNKIDNFSIEEDLSIVEKTFKGWIGRITANTSIDKIRAKKDANYLEDLHDGDLVHHAVHASTRLEESDILKLLYELPEIQRSIFNLYEIEGYTHEEIGTLLNIPDSTSRTYLTRAKAKLRKLYTEQFNVLDYVNHS